MIGPDVVVGNPPFVGDKKMRGELGDAYTEALRAAYKGRVPGGADLVCYWFERARAQIAAGALQRAGLVSTNSIRGGRNREVLDRVVATTRIFEAWSDEPWVNDGAAVRVSLVAFGADDHGPRIDGVDVPRVLADLKSAQLDDGGLDLPLARNINGSGTAFIGTQKGGSFDIPGQTARLWLQKPNPHGRGNADVLAPWMNGIDIVRRPQDKWIVNFADMAAENAMLFEAPWAHCNAMVRTERQGNAEARSAASWWHLQRGRPEFARAKSHLHRCIATARVAKYRLFVFAPAVVVPDSQVVAVARADDTTLGLLHSRCHELWSLRMCTWMGKGNDPRYTPTTCFETFPFPAGLTPADTAHQRTEALADGAMIPADLAPDVRAHADAIARAAKRLTDLRDAWLNPPEWTERVPEVVPLGMATSPYPDRIVAKPGHEADLARRTLTNLYNQRPAWLAQAHAVLDAAVAAAYGWADDRDDMADDELLRRLLALNLARAGR